MLFNSLSYLLFLPLLFILHWFFCSKTKKSQNLLLLVASYFFYSCWDWRFLFLLIFSTGLDFISGIKISSASSSAKRKMWLILSVVINLGFLGIFKYYNFFANSFADLLNKFGLHVDIFTLQIILPVGISFYTFHGLSYVLDVYNRKINIINNFLDYALFVCFFPLLVAGPIERASHLLPQVQRLRIFNQYNAVRGMRQILWGFFKKIVVADNCSDLVNLIFSGADHYNGSTLWVGSLLFTFQIYGDFSGYSDIALGTAKLFGIELLRNFSFPYFSKSMSEFWKRWHISLSSWFRDYLYIPLGGNQFGIVRQIRNVLIVFLVSGFWHGANWTFIFWGFLNAILVIPSLFYSQKDNHSKFNFLGLEFTKFIEWIKMILTFNLIILCWIFFRSESISKAFFIIGRIINDIWYARSEIVPIQLFVWITILMIVEWIGRKGEHGFSFIDRFEMPYIRWAIYVMTIFVLLHFGNFKENVFIYFQF